jgi:glycosyltransferase involved in cell wall biosynthesis
VSDEVAAAIVSTGLVNGPVHVIPNGIDLGDLPPTTLPRDIPVLIAGMKNPAFARTVEDRLRRAGIEAECLVEPLPRAAFLERLARSVVAITLPVEREGFFLPGLEAMAVGAVVVCPDCVGNRGFCRDRETAFRPAYAVEDVVAAAIEAIGKPPQAADAMRAAAAREVRHHGLEAERLAFLRILDAV